MGHVLAAACGDDRAAAQHDGPGVQPCGAGVGGLPASGAGRHVHREDLSASSEAQPDLEG
eukprot:2544129-Alexandrium_andersonii.AAC.1